MTESQLPPLPRLEVEALKHLAGPFPMNDCFTRAEAEGFAREYDRQAVLAERERCANLCEGVGNDLFGGPDTSTEMCAAAIRNQLL